MPFLWKTVIPQGQIYGDRDAHSDASVTNGFNFSYPGYNETLTGFGDPTVDSNDNVPNHNVTVLEWLNKQQGLQGQVAAFGAWNVIAAIVNAGRCGFPVNAGYEPFEMSPMTPRLEYAECLEGGDAEGVGWRALRCANVQYGDGVHQGEEAAGGVSVAWRDGRVGAWRELRGVSERGEPGG